MIEFFSEFFQYAFLKRAFVSCVCLSFGSAPVGCLLVLRRMSLMGDALSHAVLPGAAIGYILAGLSLPMLGIGGFISGLLVALLSGFVSRYTDLKEDASFAGFFLIALALGVLIISIKQNSVDLIHILFGSALAVDEISLVLMGVITTLTLVALAVIIRPLIIECFDPHFFQSNGGWGTFYHGFFLTLVVLNLVSGFQSLGTLLSLSIMMIPAITARFWVERIWSLFILSAMIALFSGLLGLMFSYYQNWPSGPSIVLVCGMFYIFSLTFGTNGSLIQKIIIKK